MIDNIMSNINTSTQ